MSRHGIICHGRSIVSNSPRRDTDAANLSKIPILREYSSPTLTSSILILLVIPQMPLQPA
jgi:hypothetical protein